MTNEEQIIWNRAAIERGGQTPGNGDKALAALLLAHGLVMNGGVLDAVEALGDELAAACNGYRFYGFENAASLLEGARVFSDEDQEEREENLNLTYSKAIPDDGVILNRFRAHFATHPELYSSIGSYARG